MIAYPMKHTQAIREFPVRLTDRRRRETTDKADAAIAKQISVEGSGTAAAPEMVIASFRVEKESVFPLTSRICVLSPITIEMATEPEGVPDASGADVLKPESLAWCVERDKTGIGHVRVTGGEVLDGERREG